MSFRIIPSIYLKDGKVVNKNTMEIVGDGDAVALATCIITEELMN